MFLQDRSQGVASLCYRVHFFPLGTVTRPFKVAMPLYVHFHIHFIFPLGMCDSLTPSCQHLLYVNLKKLVNEWKIVSLFYFAVISLINGEINIFLNTIIDHLYFIFRESFVHILYPFSIRLFIFFLLTCKNSLFFILILCLSNRLSIFLTCLWFFGNFCDVTELWLIVWSTLLNFSCMAFDFYALSKKLPVP